MSKEVMEKIDVLPPVLSISQLEEQSVYPILDTRISVRACVTLGVPPPLGFFLDFVFLDFKEFIKFLYFLYFFCIFFVFFGFGCIFFKVTKVTTKGNLGYY